MEEIHKKLVKENVWKHIVILVFVTLFVVFNSLETSIDGNNVGNVLVLISILFVSVCFANFAFTYRDTKNVEVLPYRLLSHAATFIFLLLTAVLLYFMCVAIKVAYPGLHVSTVWFSVLLYTGFVLYDFWDIFRTR